MSDPKPETPATPDEITKKLEEFIKNSLGGQVLFTKIDSSGMRSLPDASSGSEPPPDEPDDAAFEFHYKPADIKAHLDRFVPMLKSLHIHFHVRPFSLIAYSDSPFLIQL